MAKAVQKAPSRHRDATAPPLATPYAQPHEQPGAQRARGARTRRACAQASTPRALWFCEPKPEVGNENIQEFKLEAVRMVKERGVTVAQAARDLRVHENVLRKWLREFNGVCRMGNDE
jgi:transposase